MRHRRTSVPSRRTHHYRPPDWSDGHRGGANAGPNGVVKFAAPDRLDGEAWETRLANYRAHLREMHGLAMSRDGD